MKYADLHVHTFYSDSTFSPEEVLSCANDKGLSAIAICDHDSVDGILPCQEAARAFDIEVIPAIEISAEEVDAEIHLLGYFIDWKSEWFRASLKEIQVSRIERIYKMVELLGQKGIDLEAEEVIRLAGKGTVGRLHLAQAMLRSGKVKSFRDAFENYIGFLKPCYVPYTKFTPKEAIETVLRVGGVPVLAHPYTLRNDDYIPEFVKYGLKGLEVYHTDHSKSTVRRYEEIARKHGLLMTGGSDCHGMGKGRVLMGGIRVPYETVLKLKEESERIRAI